MISTSTIGMPTHVAHLRVLINPDWTESTPPRADRSAFTLYLNPKFHTPVQPFEPKTGEKKPDWVDELAIDLARRTCSGTIAKGTYRYINFYPNPAAKREADERLAAQGIRMEISPHASEDGTLTVWVEYTRQPAENG